MIKEPGEIMEYPSGRIEGFDFLRGIAILLTLFRHTYDTGNILYEIGWISVHIFFVLSSFLIVDILIKEYYRTGKINYFRFFIRRGLKIYPLYYLFIFISVVHNRHEIFSDKNNIILLAGQIFHIQNYLGCLWYHTWSLAAEEHFYLGICFLLFLLLKFYRQFFVKGLMIFFVIIILLTVVLRYLASREFSPDWFQQTHLIMDSFAFGGLLAACKHAYPKVFYRLLSLKHLLLIPIVLFIIPLIIYPLGSIQLNSFGHSSMYFAFTISLLYLISIENLVRQNFYLKLLFKPISWFGIAYYSIYLFHVMIRTLVNKSFIYENFKIPVYIIASIIIGKLLWWAVEKPIMNLKMRYYKV